MKREGHELAHGQTDVYFPQRLIREQRDQGPLGGRGSTGAGGVTGTKVRFVHIPGIVGAKEIPDFGKARKYNCYHVNRKLIKDNDQ
jgi:hypothetical protein